MNNFDGIFLCLGGIPSFIEFHSSRFLQYLGWLNPAVKGKCQVSCIQAERGPLLKLTASYNDTAGVFEGKQA